MTESRMCIGVPYGTHLWQVGDSPQLNGCFKLELTKEKRHLLSLRGADEQKFYPTDIIPLVKKS